MAETLPDFLLRCIGEDEASMPQGFDCWYDPDRYRREAEAHRRIVEELSEFLTRAHAIGAQDETPTTLYGIERQLRHLATIYADRPGYRSEWKP